MSPREGPLPQNLGDGVNFRILPVATRQSLGRLVGVLAQNKAFLGLGGGGGWTIPLKRSTPDFPWPPTPRVASLFKDSIYVRGSAQLPILMLPLIGCVTLNKPYLPCATVFSLVKWEK